jgi:hypothetical protein
MMLTVLGVALHCRNNPDDVFKEQPASWAVEDDSKPAMVAEWDFYETGPTFIVRGHPTDGVAGGTVLFLQGDWKIKHKAVINGKTTYVVEPRKAKQR